MTATKFEELLNYVAPHSQHDEMRRQPIRPPERLCVTLRFLVTGDSFNTIAASYRMSETAVGRVVKETCNVLWMALKREGFLNVPQACDQWKELSKGFENRWNFPNCVGAIDG